MSKLDADFYGIIFVFLDWFRILTIHIYGLIGEDDYWHKCKVLMENLPPNVTARYAGMLAHSDVSVIYRLHDLFFSHAW